MTFTIRGGNCPIVDTWWQTETGLMDDRPAPGNDVLQARVGDGPLPGVSVDVVDNSGHTVGEVGSGDG
jgi:acetyl-CoA synthetase